MTTIVRTPKAFGFQVNGDVSLRQWKYALRTLHRNWLYPVTLKVSVREGWAYYRGWAIYYRNLPKAVRKTFRSVRQMYKKEAGDVIRIPGLGVTK